MLDDEYSGVELEDDSSPVRNRLWAIEMSVGSQGSAKATFRRQNRDDSYHPTPESCRRLERLVQDMMTMSNADVVPHPSRFQDRAINCMEVFFGNTWMNLTVYLEE